MDHSAIIKQISLNGKTFAGLFSGAGEEEARWKPAPGKWCLLEIVSHLYDEEREDFRARVKHTLEAPLEPLPPIDPAGWVESRKYMQRDFNETLHAFLEERKKSVSWLNSLEAPAWQNAHPHPKFGMMSAGMFLANWLAHDYLHFRQITATRFQYLRYATKESLGYAGDW